MDMFWGSEASILMLQLELRSLVVVCHSRILAVALGLGTLCSAHGHANACSLQLLPTMSMT